MTWQEALAFAFFELGEEHFPESDEDGVTTCSYCAVAWPCDIERWSWDAAQILLDGIADADRIEFERGRATGNPFMHQMFAWELRDIIRSREKYER